MESKKNTGAIFKNSYKQKETHPDYKGKINVEGKDYEVSLWIKEGQNGKFFSASIQEPYKKEEPKQFNAKAYAIAEANKMFKRDIEKEYEPEDDDLPF